MNNKKHIIFSEHSLLKMGQRKIKESEVIDVISNPQQMLEYKEECVVYQSKYYDKICKKKMLLRIITIHKKGEILVITAYKTSKINKYFKEL